MYNQVGICGRLTADPKFTVTQNGKKCATFTIAHQQSKDDTDFFDCVCFDNQAEVAKTMMVKGMKITIGGRMKYHKWTGKDGENKKKLEIQVTQIELPSRAEPGSASGYSAPSYSAPGYSQPTAAQPEYQPIEDEDTELPF